MKKKLLAILTSVLLLCSMLPLGAVSVSAEVTSGTTGDCTWTLDGTHLTISGNGEMDNYDAWGEGVVYTAPWGSQITTVTIENGVTTIGDRAFEYCDSLTSVTIPDSVTSIGRCAFVYCTSLTSVTIPNRVTDIEYGAFDYCSSLTSVTIPARVTYIGSNAFNECSALTAIDVDTNNYCYSSLDGVLFNKEQTTLIQYPNGKPGDSYTIPGSVDTIEYAAFYGCSLTSVIIPDSVITISNNAFDDCSALASVTIGNSVTTIGYGAFDRCFSLTSVTIGDSVTTIRDNAFCMCTSLTSITIPESVTSIGDNAFCMCTSLTSITIPESVTSIGDDAFFCCESLTSIDVNKNNPNYSSLDGVLFDKNQTTLIQYPGGKSGNYTIPDSVTTIGDNAFLYCTSLTSITIPESVTTIGNYAFSDCTSLTSVTIPDSVTSIGDYAFYWCDSLTDVYYAGTKAQKATISIGSDNDPLLDATWHYNYINVKDQYDATVTHSVMDTENGNGLAFRFELSANGVAMKNRTEADLSNATVNYLGNDCKLVGMGAVITNDANLGNSKLTREQSNGQRVIDIPVVYLQEVTDTSCAFATRLINIPDTALECTIYARPYYIVEVDGEEIVIYGDVDAASCAEYM